jgi:hypothetical protein
MKCPVSPPVSPQVSVRVGCSAGEIEERSRAHRAARFRVRDDLPGVYRRVQGRWPGSHAPEFVHVGDHLKLDVGGDRDWPQLTLAAWVRWTASARRISRCCTRMAGIQAIPGQVTGWSHRHATMRLALRPTPSHPAPTNNTGPTPALPCCPEQGRWVHLATVYDSQAKTVRFYLNGSLTRKSAFKSRIPPGSAPRKSATGTATTASSAAAWMNCSCSAAP